MVRYISEELCNPQAAERFCKSVEDKLRMLHEHPYMFPLHQDETLRKLGYTLRL
ncbi:MAG: hypothetical protein LBS21_14310 [Clostridiales bacterium]|nr:hypothetical protein [Clostridiales bacterium]